ncbi:hypothetical protein ILUMI_01772 [Ignelater luminosus]|uniref:Retrovirus-related Pol polyprotein from transposon TNT 1-94-like beta-barrel domain-containing protein n=1 Tax=Ignelater luminosus TaxID=2038154 RepID=A0A8K0GJX7_IGNLU|nr:hypothetical protein ILUMI_01772 [Ignelater luminosus]
MPHYASQIIDSQVSKTSHTFIYYDDTSEFYAQSSIIENPPNSPPPSLPNCSPPPLPKTPPPPLSKTLPPLLIKSSAPPSSKPPPPPLPSTPPPPLSRPVKNRNSALYSLPKDSIIPSEPVYSIPVNQTPQMRNKPPITPRPPSLINTNLHVAAIGIDSGKVIDKGNLAATQKIVNTGSDHRMLRAQIGVNTKKERKKLIQNKTEKLVNIEEPKQKRAEYEQRLAKHIEKIDRESNLKHRTSKHNTNNNRRINTQAKREKKQEITKMIENYYQMLYETKVKPPPGKQEIHRKVVENVGSEEIPEVWETIIQDTEPKEDEDHKIYKRWKKKDSHAQQIITTRMDEALLVHVMTCNKASEMWVKLKSIYEQSTEMSLQILLGQCFSFKYDESKDIATHISNLTTLVNKIKEAGECISEAMKCINENLSDTETEEKWYLDSGCNSHMTSHIKYFSHYTPYTSSNNLVKIGDGRLLEAKGIGDIQVIVTVKGEIIESVQKNVLYVPELHLNLFSLGVCMEKGYSVQGEEDIIYLKKNDKLYVEAIKNKNLFVINMKVDTRENCEENNLLADYASGIRSIQD